MSDIIKYSIGPKDATTDPETQVYFRRYRILLIFILYSIPNTFQWIQYAIITNIVSEYYGVSRYLVNWTSTIFLAVYIPLIIPGAWLLKKKGLRFVVLLAAIQNCLASWIKVASISPDRFYLVLIGQVIAGCAQPFILGLPAKLAAVWFGSEQVSRACGCAFLGIQIGIALGFLVPPLMVPSSKDKAIVGAGLLMLNQFVAAFATVILVVIIFFFPEKPPIPPSIAQAKALTRDVKYTSTMKNLLTDRNYRLLAVSFGLNVGVFNAVSTLLNQTILCSFSGYEKEAGWIGLIIVFSGVVGSNTCGIILDKTHKFKETTLAVYFFTLCGMFAYLVVLEMRYLWAVFFFSGILGFFMNGYIPIGLEFASEITYPEPEGTSSGILNCAAQVFGLITTFTGSFLLEEVGLLFANLLFVLILVVGVGLTVLMNPELKRYKASRSYKNQEIIEISNPNS